MHVQALIDRLLAQCGCTLHSEIGPAPSDIDLYVPAAHMAQAEALITGAGFVRTSRNEFQSVFRRFEGGQLFIIDLISDFNIYTQHLASLTLSDVGSARISQSATLHKSFKYLCYRRMDKMAYLEAHREELADFLKDTEDFVRIDPRSVAAANAPVEAWLHAVRFSAAGWLRPRLAMLGTGFSIAFIGPDGSGKSFFIEKFRPAGVTRKIYMGDWFFALQPLYNLLMKIPSPYNRFLYGLYLIENYMRLLRVWWLRLLGRIVLIDRFPGTNRNIAQDGGLGRINRFIFRIFPKPDLLVLLHAPPEIVHQRKQELSIEAIGKMQERLRALLAGTRHKVLDTQALDDSLNALLRAVYARRGQG